ncbi:sperm-associated antigen 8-like [Anneissia japonica]|uniref:sperm-associated antigen 8-like n=1 Tax=Anneissia japonica TaxID=1529436 RepID=UPI0014257A21|nr:sperm-associated antigen 8-like [Anneissia japonica]
MTTLNPSRTFNNSDGKCLLENWVEERQCQDLGYETITEDERQSTAASHPFKDGHPGILSMKQNETEKLTTCKDSYRQPPKPQVRTKGRKKELLERALYAQVSQEVHNEFNPPPPEVEYTSITKKDFTVEGFQSKEIEPEFEHNVETEQPITFWSSHKNKIHGVTQVKTTDTPFKKNTAFSKPISEYTDESEPYDAEKYPWM